MLFTLLEALHQIDPNVVMDDGCSARTVGQIIFSIDPMDVHDYVIDVDAAGRLVIYQIDHRGYAIYPARYVERKVVGVRRTASHLFGSPVSMSFVPRLA